MNLPGFCPIFCVSSISPYARAGPSYEADKTPSKDAAKALLAEAGTVIHIQSSVIEYGAKTAQAVRAGMGGIVAIQAAKDSYSAVRAAATAADAAAGAIAGDMLASGALSPEAEKLISKLDNWQVISVTQEPGG